MDICRWRLLRAGHSTPTQRKVQFSLTFQVLWWWWNLQSTSSHPCPPPVGSRSDKILHWAMTLLHFYKLFSVFPLVQAGTALHPVGVCPWPSASLQLSSQGSDCWGTNSQYPPAQQTVIPGNRLWQCLFPSAPSLYPVPHPQLSSASSGGPGNLGFAPAHALVTRLLRLTNKEAN